MTKSELHNFVTIICLLTWPDARQWLGDTNDQRDIRDAIKQSVDEQFASIAALAREHFNIET